MEKSKEVVIESLKTFAKQEQKVVTSELEDILKDIAKTGKYIYPWATLKPLFLHQLEQVTKSFLDSMPPKISDEVDTEKLRELEDLRKTIVESFSKFSSAPFTIQRLSELLVNPKRHYKTPAKFFRGLEKNVLVVSTVDPEESDERPSKRIKLTNIPEAEQNGLLEETSKLPTQSESESELVNSQSGQVSDQDKVENRKCEQSNGTFQISTPISTSAETSVEIASDEERPSPSTDGECSLENSDLEKSEKSAQSGEEIPLQQLKDETTTERNLESTAQTEQIVPSNNQDSEDTVTSDEPMDQS